MSRAIVKPGIAVLALASFATACATPPPPPVAVMAPPAGPCDESMGIEAPLLLEVPNPNRASVMAADVTAETACWSNPETGINTPYVIAQLPQSESQLLLTVIAPLDRLRTLATDVRTLDANGQVVRHFERDRFVTLGDGYSLQLTPRAEEAMVAVSVDPELVGLTHESIEMGISTSQVYTGYGTATMYHGHDLQTERSYSFEGRVVFRLLNVE
ncbi:hypothetical protein [Maricaulis sp.]|uniref:hypothetical protein n=1 Tax=Maricaulis sp. TaxID=1486257 RepID=UPI0025D3EE87|nr:hypothetical protein [Maricaulis sp.]MDF1768216.1 hypothetical protein [Maricaulis sp.]